GFQAALSASAATATENLLQMFLGNQLGDNVSGLLCFLYVLRQAAACQLTWRPTRAPLLDSGIASIRTHHVFRTVQQLVELCHVRSIGRNDLHAVQQA